MDGSLHGRCLLEDGVLFKYVLRGLAIIDSKHTVPCDRVRASRGVCQGCLITVYVDAEV